MKKAPRNSQASLQDVVRGMQYIRDSLTEAQTQIITPPPDDEFRQKFGFDEKPYQIKKIVFEGDAPLNNSLSINGKWLNFVCYESFLHAIQQKRKITLQTQDFNDENCVQAGGTVTAHHPSRIAKDFKIFGHNLDALLHEITDEDLAISANAIIASFASVSQENPGKSR